MSEEQPKTNGVSAADELDESTPRPADIEADMKEMDRRKRVDAIMNSRLFREELERIVDTQTKEGPSGILQQLSDMMGIPAARVGSVFKSSNCVVPINDIRGIESMGYAKGEKILRCKLAATFRLIDLHGWTQGMNGLVTARLNADQELFLVNPHGLFYHEMTASSLNKVNMQGVIIEQGTTNFGVNQSQFQLHSVIHAARPDLRCAIYLSCSPVMAVSALKNGLLPVTKSSVVLGDVNIHPFMGSVAEPEEKEKLLRSLGPIAKVLFLTNHGAVCCGETIEEAFYNAYHLVQACEAQLKLMPLGMDNIVLIPEESRKIIYDASRKAPEMAAVNGATNGHDESDKPAVITQNAPKWRVGGQEFEAAMRMLDNAGFRTGYIYRQPLIKSEIPKPKNDVELPPAVSSLGYLLEEEELYRQGIWKKGDPRGRGDRSKWLNSPNVYQKVEVLETGTPDPKKITKWVSDDSPSHSSNAPVRIESALQFVPQGTNPKEFKRLQQQIKDNRRADIISAGPQSHILEGVTWDEAHRINDAAVSAAGDHVVLMGAASKGIIQRNYQHNAQVYKTAYAKNPFDCVTDDEITEYKRTVARKVHGDNTDTDFSESEALSSLPMSGPPKAASVVSPPSMSDSEHHEVLRIETKTAPKPSQVEVVLSDATAEFLNTERLNSNKGKSPAKGQEDSQELTESEVDEERNADKWRKPSLTESTVTVGSFESQSTNVNVCGDTSEATTVSVTNHANRSLCRRKLAPNHRRSQSSSPYRTNAYFGFNGARFAAPTHFHLPNPSNSFKPLRRSISLEEMFSTGRYLECGEDKWDNLITSKLLAKKVISSMDRGLNEMQACGATSGNASNHSVDLTAISEESRSQEKSGDSIIQDILEEAVERALIEYHPNEFLETIRKMGFSSESTAAGIQPNEASITTSFHSLRQDKSPVKVMGREERQCRKKEFIELWDNHIAQEQNISLEYQCQPLNTTEGLISQGNELQKELHRISDALDARKKLFATMNIDDLDERERLLLYKLEDYNLAKDENSIFFRIEQSILNKDRSVSRCMSVESTGTQTSTSVATSTPNQSRIRELFDHTYDGRPKSACSGDKSRIPIRSPKPRALFELNENVPKPAEVPTGVKPKVPTKAALVTKVRTNSSAIFSVSPFSTPAKENVNIFQKKDKPSPCLWVTMNQKGNKRVAESPITPRTAKKPLRTGNVTLRRRADRQQTLGPNATSAVELVVQENRVNTFRDMDLETEKLRGTIDRCTEVISDIGQSVQEMKVSLAEVATAQNELTEEIRTLNKSR